MSEALASFWFVVPGVGILTWALTTLVWTRWPQAEGAGMLRYKALAGTADKTTCTGVKATSTSRDGKVRFVCVSDTHGHHRELGLPSLAGDVLLHAGDFTQNGLESQVRDFNEWLGEIKHLYKHIIVICGNHDLCLDSGPPREVAAKLLTNCTCLFGESIEVLGINLYGNPVHLPIGRKYQAFTLDSKRLKAAWDEVPSDTDVILSHAPPLGYCDSMWGLKHAGCEQVLAACKRAQPSVLVCGHIHSGYGTAVMASGTVCINAASMTPLRKIKGLNAPVIFDALPEHSRRKDISCGWLEIVPVPSESVG